ncbi:MAG: histidinol-phosphate transaminase [Candidatus Bathyarchaeota archaeon]|nr:MAG: histidinol-phosphate transaminase [Candidatus Bathyarchaeota archaeon]
MKYMRTRREMEDIEPYSWEKSSREIAQEFDLPVDKIIRFDLNTSPDIPQELLEKAIQSIPRLKIHEYPDTSYRKLSSLLAEYCEVNIDQITVTNGADEALDIISKVFLDSESNVVVSDPTYSMFRIVSKIMGAKVKGVLRNEDLTDNFDRIKDAVDEGSRVVFLCSPNNPTGTCISRTDLLKFLQSTDCAVVVDEAYYEFSGETLIDLINEYENLIVVRTFSKAFSLAGARVGYMCTSKKTADFLNKVRPPNSLTVFSLELARLALDNIELMKSNVSALEIAKEKMKKNLEKIGLYVYPSKANFLLVDFGTRPPSLIQSMLMEKGIVVRDISSMPMLQRCLRITVLREEQNQQLVQTLAEILAS